MDVTERDDIGLSIDMLDVDRLREWARLLLVHGADIEHWGGSVTHVAGKMQTIATGMEKAIRDIGALRAERLRGLPATLEPPIDTYTPILWATLSDDGRWAEYVRVRELATLRGLPGQPLTNDEIALLASIMVDHAQEASESEDVDRNAEAPYLHTLAHKLALMVPVGHQPKFGAVADPGSLGRHTE